LEKKTKQQRTECHGKIILLHTEKNPNQPKTTERPFNEKKSTARSNLPRTPHLSLEKLLFIAGAIKLGSRKACLSNGSQFNSDP